MAPTTLTTNEAVVAGGILGGALAATIIVSLAIVVLIIVAWWKIFNKAGQPGWKAIIPIYNMYTYYKICGMSGAWAFLPLIEIVLFGILSAIGGYTINATTGAATFSNAGIGIVVGIMAIVFTIIEIVVYIMSCIKLGRAFGRGVIFKIITVLFFNIGLLVLAFGGSKYNAKAVEKK